MQAMLVAELFAMDNKPMGHLSQKSKLECTNISKEGNFHYWTLHTLGYSASNTEI